MSTLGRRLNRPAVLTRRLHHVTPRQSVRHHSTILEGMGSVVASTAESLSYVHTSGLPWYIVIPLLATGLNFTVRLPARYLGRLYDLRKREHGPLRSAWAYRIALEDKLKGPSSQRGLSKLGTNFSLLARERRRISRKFGTQSWKTWSIFLGPMVPFVLVSEAVRRLAGSPMTWLGEKLGLDRFLDKLEPGTSSLTDTSLAEGGILWFTDLMAADPYGGLPLLCALGLGWSSWSRLDAKRLRELLRLDSKGTTSAQRLSRALGRGFLIIPLFPLLFWNLPSAIFLYWAPTFIFNGINDRLVKAWLPDRKSRYVVSPGKRQVGTRHVGIEGYDIPSKKEVRGAKATSGRS